MARGGNSSCKWTPGPVNRRLVGGMLALAWSLATAGSIITAPEIPSLVGGREHNPIGSQILAPEIRQPARTQPAPPRLALDATVRSARLENQTPEPSLGPVPIRVVMDTISTQAPVIAVGVDSHHQFDVPEAATIGWYRHSSLPGAKGASVLAAHVDYEGQPGAFFRLHQLVPGDVVKVELDNGSQMDYTVIGNTIYDKSELPSNELFRKDGESVLQLITCGGTFDPAARTYDANLVVTATPLAGSP